MRRLLGSPDLMNCLVNQDASGSTSNNVSVNNENNEMSVLFRPNQCLNVNMRSEPLLRPVAEQVHAPLFHARRFSGWGRSKAKRRWVTLTTLSIIFWP